MTLEIIKHMENIGVWWIRRKTREIIQYVKENRVNRPTSTMSSTLSRRKSGGLKKPGLRSKKSIDLLSYDNSNVETVSPLV
jgi:hypothetical protein